MTRLTGTYSAPMPADVDAPDKVVYGLTFRQLAILAVAAVVLYAGWHVAAPRRCRRRCCSAARSSLGGLAFGVAVGRRDGLPLDVWLLAAVRYTPRPAGAVHASTPTAPAPGLGRHPGRPGARCRRRCGCPPTRSATTARSTSAAAAAAIVAATTVNLAPAHRRRAGRAGRRVRPVAELPDQRRRRSSCPRSRSTWHSARPHPRRRRGRAAAPGAGGGVRRPRRGSSPTWPTAATRCAGRSSSSPAPRRRARRARRPPPRR